MARTPSLSALRLQALRAGAASPTSALERQSQPNTVF